MTREEAIDILQNTSFFGRTVDDIDTAIDMAIEALQQEPKVGEWYLDDEWRCSVCNCVCEDWRGIPTYKYCPQCGSYVGKRQEVET